MGYWENRQAELMVGYMQTAEDAAAEIARAYEAAAAYMQQEIDKVFQRFVSEYGLTEEAAKRILGNVTDLRSLNSLRAAVIASGEDADELLAEMNSGAYAARMRRWEDVQDSLDEVIGRLRGAEQRESTACYRSIAERAYTGTIEGVEQMVGFDFTYTAIDPSAIDLVLRTPFAGQNYSQRIWNNTQAVAESVREQMLLGVMTGKSQSQMAELITERFSVGASNARRLVRTESAFVANEMQAQAYEECGADEYEYVATLDMRTSEVCQALDGQVFAVRDRQVGVNYPPMHPYCRSTTVIHLDEETVEGLERRRIARDQTTGQNTYVPADMTYRQWTGEEPYEQVPLRQEPQQVPEPITTPEHQRELDDALEYYASGDGMYVNKYLRDPAGFLARDNWTAEDEQYLRLLDEATSQPVDERKLYRSVDASAVFGRMSQGDYEDLRNYVFYGESSVARDSRERIGQLADIVGREITEPGFMSTTKDADVAFDWSDFTGSEKPIVLDLDVPEGICGADMSAFDVEGAEQYEVLLARNQRYRITGIGRENGSFVLHALLLL